MLTNKIHFIIIFFYFILYLQYNNSKHKKITIQYFLIKNRFSLLRNEIMDKINNIMDIEVKRYAILGYNDAINNFDGNNTISGFIKNNLNENLRNCTLLLFPIEILYKENIDHFKYKVTPYIEKIRDLNIPLQYKPIIIKYCNYSNIKTIRSVYKINKIIKLSSEEYIKKNTAKSFIKWKLRKFFL